MLTIMVIMTTMMLTTTWMGWCWFWRLWDYADDDDDYDLNGMGGWGDNAGGDLLINDLHLGCWGLGLEWWGLALFGSAGSRRIRGRRPLLLNCATSPHIKGGGGEKTDFLLTVLSDIRHNLSPLSISPFSLLNFVHFQPLSLSLKKGKRRWLDLENRPCPKG